MKATVVTEGICVVDLLEGNAVMLQQCTGRYTAGWHTIGDNRNIKEERQKKNHEAMDIDRNHGNSVSFRGIRI